MAAHHECERRQTIRQPFRQPHNTPPQRAHQPDSRLPTESIKTRQSPPISATSRLCSFVAIPGSSSAGTAPTLALAQIVAAAPSSAASSACAAAAATAAATAPSAAACASERSASERSACSLYPAPSASERSPSERGGPKGTAKAAACAAACSLYPAPSEYPGPSGTARVAEGRGCALHPAPCTLGRGPERVRATVPWTLAPRPPGKERATRDLLPREGLYPGPVGAGPVGAGTSAEL